jgi:glycosyltransferase involved in cell wall biosynthesis
MIKQPIKVTIIWRLLAHYRVPFYEKLREILDNKNITLQLIYGQGNKNDLAKNDEREIAWGRKITNHYFGPFLWQPCFQYLHDSQMVIVESANRLLLNYFLMSKRIFSSQKLAYWSHGRNMQISDSSILNKIKRMYGTHCDWWFAYTEGVKDYIVQTGFPSNKITIVQNAIDTTSLKHHHDTITLQELKNTRIKYNIGKGPIGIFCGGIYADKKIEFLIDSCKRIRKTLSNFELIVVGSGIQQDLVENESNKNAWIHYVGNKFEKEKVVLLALSDIFLMPGLVGLAILDAFALGLPLVTTNYPFHSPEIEYLKTGWNGKITEMDVDSYASAVIEILQNKILLKTLKENCLKSSEKYTVETMAENYASGIIKCLQANH